MKNIHILSTDQSSRLCIDNSCNELNYSEKEGLNSKHITNQCMYITSDEEIKEGDYCVDGNDIYGPYEDGDIATDKFIKIILTTDSQLIRYGVQAIDDEFLKWFVENPTCEFVEVNKKLVEFPLTFKMMYKIIIPQEEPKQETLEEAAYRLSAEKFERKHTVFMLGVIEGAKWKAERMYSEEDMRKSFFQGWVTRERFDDQIPDIIYPQGLDYEEKQEYAFNLWFEQFKKK